MNTEYNKLERLWLTDLLNTIKAKEYKLAMDKIKGAIEILDEETENKAAKFNKQTETILDAVENMNTALSKRKLEALECEDCHVSSMDVVETICPFNQDVHGKEIPATLCTVCYNNRCDDI